VQLETLQNKLPSDLYKRVVWLDKLPMNFIGLIIANEVLDALPVHLLIKKNNLWLERGVAFDVEFTLQDKPLSQANLADNLPKESLKNLPNDYLTEVCPAALGLMNSLVDCLQQGIILMLDYGFGAAEYYHPQRSQGTLMCHYQQLAHDNPLINIGLQDITAHVNFTLIASILDVPCEPVSMRLAGYVNQAQFLINCGILDILSETSPNDVAAYLPLAAAAQKLLSPAEMGELFKVIAISKNLDVDLTGFKSGDKSHTL
jgi:SAM-dependent MidA family methyltransferase